MYKSDFKELVEYCFNKSTENYKGENRNPNPFYIGYGNPNSDFLIVGQEKAIDPLNFNQVRSESIDNPTQWKKLIDENIYDFNYQYYGNSVFNNPLHPYSERAKGNKVGATWYYYQKLVSKLYPNQNYDLLGNPFFEKSFITELNHELSPKKLGYRPHGEREKLWKFNFYQNFSKILLSVGDYINIGDVERLFDIEFVEDYSQPNEKLILFKNEKKNKILIQTRQLSSGVSNVLLDNITNEFKR
jgi:hypothetical protein